MSCIRCGGDMEGDGYSAVLHCENSDESTYEFHEPDAGPVFCNCKSAEEELELSVFKQWEAGVEWEDIAKNLGRPLSILLTYRGIMDLYLK